LVPSKWVRRFGNGEVYPKKAVSDPDIDFSAGAITELRFCGPLQVRLGTGFHSKLFNITTA
jgi:hypothetical protein